MTRRRRDRGDARKYTNAVLAMSVSAETVINIYMFEHHELNLA